MKNKQRKRRQRFSFIAREQRHDANSRAKVTKAVPKAVTHLPPPARDIVTDHALLRWLERVHDIDIEGIRAILREQVRAVSEAGIRVHNDGSHVYVFNADGVLVTVMHENGAAQ